MKRLINKPFIISLILGLISVACTSGCSAKAHDPAPATIATETWGGGVRTVSGISIGVNSDASRVVFLPAGRLQTLALADTASETASKMVLQGAGLEIEEVAINRTGDKIAAIVKKKVKKTVPNGRVYYIESYYVILISPSKSTYYYLNSNADTYFGHISFSADGIFLYYSRSTKDRLDRKSTDITKYTHQYNCCGEGAYIARYDLSKDIEEIIGPFMAPQGNMLLDFQATNKNLYFYSHGLTAPIAFNYDPGASREQRQMQEHAAEKQFAALFLAKHPTEVERNLEPSEGTLGEYLFRASVSQSKSDADAIRITPDQLGLNNIISTPEALDRLHPQISDDEERVYFVSENGSCWGERNSAVGINCHNLGAGAQGGLLSHDGAHLVFMDQEELGNQDTAPIAGRICVLDWHHVFKQCAWYTPKYGHDQVISEAIGK